MSISPVSTTLEDLLAQPVPQFAELDTPAIKASLAAKFESLTGRVLYPAQVEMFMIEVMAYALSVHGSAIQNGLMQNRAIWAEGQHLDQLGANVDTYRLAAQSARADVVFSLSEAQAQGVVVPAGTRVAAGDALAFATVDELVIPAGDLTGQVAVIASDPGASHNDLLPGQVSDILDPVAHVSAVANIQITAGGSDIENDARFRLRILNAFERITRGGSRAGYVELVREVSPDIVDVAVIRPEPGHIHIYPLHADGVAPDAVDAAILAHLDPETRIPMGDFVSIQKAQSQAFDVAITIKAAPGYAASVSAGVEAAIRALFDAWGQKLGAQIAPSAVVEAARSVTGVVGVDGPAFAFTDLPASAFASLQNLTIDVEEAPNV